MLKQINVVNVDKETFITIKCLSIIYNKSIKNVLSKVLTELIESDEELRTKVDKLKQIISFE